MAEFRIQCSGCGATVDAATHLPFRCPNAAENDNIDHVLVRTLIGPDATFPDSAEPNPFIRYRHLSLGYHLARANGLSDDQYVGIVKELDDAVATVDGKGFRITPFASVPALSDRCGGEVWVKNETGNVSGSHKARHLMGVMIYLRVLEAANLPAANGLRDRRLAIASCGNAALAAAVIARAADWPLDVFIPPDAEDSVKQRLAELGAQLHICERQPGQMGDPCYLGFRKALEAGSLSFGVQGNETGLAIEGGQTLGWEMADALRQAGADLDMLFVQVGGGALGSACYRGLVEAVEAGVINRVPKLFTVQTKGAYPLKKAFDAFGADGKNAARNRSAYMTPWPTEPHSVAHGILDDETYDWLALVEGMTATGGDALIADEESLREANRVARETTGIDVSHTGSAGLAGLMNTFREKPDADLKAAVLFTGIER
ncbi:MAG: pyridoxal-phosphate dependent enzyme [Rhodospirillales bacterium]|nr:pyridoxal-phosphate dependent enzyme [Rhodospirillales bacterium]